MSDQQVYRYLEKVVVSDKAGRLVPVTSAKYADLVVAFVPKSLTNSDPTTWPAGMLGSNHRERMVAYTYAKNGRMRLVWFDEAAKKPESAILSLLKALEADSKEAMDSSKDVPDAVSMNDQSRSPIVKPMVTYREAAVYTSEARKNKVEGVVVISVVFGIDGKLRAYRVKKGLPYGLTAAAVQAASKIQFKPATRHGKEIEVRGDLEFSFMLY